MRNQCHCLASPGYWQQATHIVTEAERQEAERYVRAVIEHNRKGASDYIIDRGRAEQNVYHARLAEVAVAKLLHQRPAAAQTSGPISKVTDLSGGIEVRWSNRPMLWFRVSGKQREVHPSAPTVLVTGDDQQMTIHGWAALSEIGFRSYKFDERRWADSPFWQGSAPRPNPAVPANMLHNLPTPPDKGRPVSMPHRGWP